MHPLRFAVPFAWTCLASMTLAQGPVALLADVEAAAPENQGSLAGATLLGGVTWGAYLYFAADADGRGKELWRSSGAVGDASIVVDLQPNGGSDPQLVGVLGGWLVFVADDGLSGRELWRTNGTAAGTQLLADLTPGSSGSFGSEETFVLFNSAYYFLRGGELWKTDGANTFAVSPTNTGADVLVAAGNRLWMAAGSDLWSSDGSSVWLVSQLPNDISGLTPLPPAQAVFACNDGINGQELWRSDGSGGGTQMLVDIQPSSGGSGPTQFAVTNGIACFRAFENSQVRLWRTDGTAAGTFVLDPANGPRSPQDLRTAGNRIWFTAKKSGGTDVGWEPWVTDGSVAGTQLVFDVWPGSATSGADDFVHDGSQWTYFRAHDGSTGYELWRSDLTTTQRVSDTVPGFGDGSPVVLGFRGVYTLFASIHEGAPELFAAQGNGSQLVKDIRRGTNGNSDPQRFAPRHDGQFWFSARRGLTTGLAGPGREPHWSSGAPGSAQLLVDSVGGYQSGADIHTRVAGFGLYTWFNTVPGSVLWRTAGTVPSTNSIPGFQVTFNDMVTFGGRVFVDATTPATGEELFVFNNPLAAPVLFKDVVPGTGGATIDNLTVAGSQLFFTANDGQGNNLWVSDGTTAGTQRAWLNTVGGNLFNLHAVGRRVFFDNGSSPGPLLVSDGTTTTNLGSVGQNSEKVAVGNRLFFVGEPTGAGTGLELCVTDGVTITLVKDVRPGSASSQPYALTPFGNGVLFLADNGTNGCELWKSDGTTAGTQLVIDLLPGVASGCPRYDGGGNTYIGWVFAERAAGRALFAGTNGSSGFEVFRTDGTAAGTVLHADIQPGLLGSFPARPARAGTQLVFAATQTELPAAAIGRELFAMPTMAIATPIGTPCSNSAATAPLAGAIGAPFLGNAAFTLTIDAEPSALAVLALGDPDEVAVGPCELRVANFNAVLVSIDPSGTSQVALPIPPTPSLTNVRACVQWGVQQANGPYVGLVALSNAVDLVLQVQ